jgi:peroxiredoxin
LPVAGIRPCVLTSYREALFPITSCPTHTSSLRKLSELQGADPLILTLAHGHYCPKEHQQHLELAAFYPKIAVAYTQIVTIATDDHHTLQEFRASVGAGWTFLSDPERRIQKDLAIQDLRVVTSEIRAGWDLSTPGLREAWEMGDRSRFHG